jgi:hypothetical protein
MINNGSATQAQRTATLSAEARKNHLTSVETLTALYLVPNCLWKQRQHHNCSLGAS